MFRALLWKEWRELWSLLIAAVALPAITFLIVQPQRHQLNPDVWEFSFSLWLFISAFYLPTHLFARDNDLLKSGSVFSMPLDRFRLWWFRMVICLSLVALIAIALYGTSSFLSYFYEKADAYELRRASIIRQSFIPTVFLLGVSLFFSTIFRKQLTALIGAALILAAIWVFWSIAAAVYEPVDILKDFFTERTSRPALLFLSAAPLLVFLSLVMFARNDMRRRTRLSAAIRYIPFGALALLLSAGAAFSSADLPKLKTVFKSKHTIPVIWAVSADGNYILLEIAGGGISTSKLLSVNVAKQEAKRIDDNFLILALGGTGADSVLYLHERLNFLIPPEVVLSDFRGTQKKALFQEILTFPGVQANWSVDAKYLGITNSGEKLFQEDKYAAIINENGDFVEKYTFPVLESADLISPIGWDNQNRFYFQRGFKKRNRITNTLWRMWPGHSEPERVQLLPDEVRMFSSYRAFPEFSPNGKWIACQKFLGIDQAELWLCDVANNSSYRLAESLKVDPWLSPYTWSPDSRLAYLEIVDKQGDHKDSQEKPVLRLVLYDPATQTSEQYSLEDHPEIQGLGRWSLSGKHLLLTTRTDKERKKDIAIFSAETGKIQLIDSGGLQFWGSIWWVSGDRLVFHKSNILYIQDADGANQREFLRIVGEDCVFPHKARE